MKPHVRRRLLSVGVGLALLVIAFVALAFGISELGGEVVTLYTRTPDGEARTHLWVVDDGGIAWLRAGQPSAGWLARLVTRPDVRVERGGRTLEFRAVPERRPEIRERIHLMMREKYGLADR